MSLTVELDRTSDAPLWFQLMRVIEAGIADGTWRMGDRIPSEHELCSLYGISRTSVREALGHLQDAGILRREQGKGAFVSTDAEAARSWILPSAPGLLGEQVESGRSALTSVVLRAGLEPVAAPIADAFGDIEGFVLERSRAVGSLTAVHTVDTLPRRFAGVASTLRDERASLFAALESVAGVRVARVQRTIEAAAADRHVASVLGVEVGYPVVVVVATAYDSDDRPVDFSRASVRTDRLQVRADTNP